LNLNDHLIQTKQMWFFIV